MKINLKCGDSIEMMREIPGHSVDMVLCDPPYGTTRCKWDTIIPFEDLWKEYKRVCKKNAAIVLFSCEPFTSNLIMSNPKMFRYDLIWDKGRGTDFLNANRKPLRRHENICVFYSAAPTYNKQMIEGKPYICVQGKKTDLYGDYNQVITENSGTRCPTTILQFKAEHGYHPTQKPVPLLEWLIKSYSNEGNTILDNCMGSGSTGVACINTKRNFIGIELEQKYYDIAQQRIDEAIESQAS